MQAHETQEEEEEIKYRDVGVGRRIFQIHYIFLYTY